MKKVKLDKFEQELEKDILRYRPVSSSTTTLQGIPVTFVYVFQFYAYRM